MLEGRRRNLRLGDLSDIQMKFDFQDGLQISALYSAAVCLPMVVSMLALVYPTKSNALASYCTENERTPTSKVVLQKPVFNLVKYRVITRRVSLRRTS